jgi:hypothetical protein
MADFYLDFLNRSTHAQVATRADPKRSGPAPG